MASTFKLASIDELRALTEFGGEIVVELGCVEPVLSNMLHNVEILLSLF